MIKYDRVELGWPFDAVEKGGMVVCDVCSDTEEFTSTSGPRYIKRNIYGVLNPREFWHCISHRDKEIIAWIESHI